jgi:CRISPR-associated protein Csd1
MLLQRLREYTERPGAVKPLPRLYAPQAIRYVLELDGAGRLLGPPIDTADPASPATRRGTRRSAPVIQRTVGIKPLLLADNAEYTFGLAQEGSRPERVAACHMAYLDLLRQCEIATGEAAVRAVRRFLEEAASGDLPFFAEVDRAAVLTFRVNGQFVIDLPAVQAFWADHNDPAAYGAPMMECLVCGRRRPVLRRLEGKLKGVPGGQSSGTSLISANAEAFESYGQAASLGAPTCADCAERFTRAINELLADPVTRIVLGGMAFVAWTREPVAFSFTTYLSQPTPELVTDLLRSVARGAPMPPVDETAFYALALSGSGGRAVVRDWIDSTVGQAKANLASWFERQSIVGPSGEEHRPLGLYALAAATVRDPRKDLGPVVPRALLHAALTGGPLSWDVLYQAIRRNRAEQTVDRSRATLIKLVLASQDPHHVEEAMVQLDVDHPSPAYHCGRLLAVLEEIQRAAMPGINATIVDRFFGTASTAPASVFGRLVRGAQPHLAKLERDRPGMYTALQRRLEEVLAPLSAFPRTLTLQGQGLFALGYYHQRAADRAAARAAAERRRGETDAASPDPITLEHEEFLA